MTRNLAAVPANENDEAGLMRLRLYVVGGTPNSMRAIQNWHAIAQEFLGGRAEMEIIDVLEAPQRLLADGILVTPTLLRLYPQPIVKIVGDLSQTDRVLRTLGVQSKS